MKMIVGLGNPGSRYLRNRHNIGFQVVDELAKKYGLNFDKRRHKAKLAIGRIGEQRLLLVKPQTFMNASGEAVQPLAAFYKIDPADIIVVSDDIDLPAGKLRLRPFGGAGGQKGMKSIIQRLGSDHFPRLRLGLDRPPGSMDAAAYVLQDFSVAEEEIMVQARDRAVRALESWLADGIDMAMNEYN